VLARMTTATGDQETMVQTLPSQGITPDDLARAILMGFPQVMRVRVWDVGQSFLDQPSADITREDLGPVSTLPDDIRDVLVDVATLVKLAPEADPTRDDAPSSLTYQGRMYPYAYGDLPPVP